jgi:hypothetical protein
VTVDWQWGHLISRPPFEGVSLHHELEETQVARKLTEPEVARQLLGAVYNWFTEGFDTAALQAAKALLEALA